MLRASQLILDYPRIGFVKTYHVVARRVARSEVGEGGIKSPSATATLGWD